MKGLMTLFRMSIIEKELNAIHDSMITFCLSIMFVDDGMSGVMSWVQHVPTRVEKWWGYDHCIVVCDVCALVFYGGCVYPLSCKLSFNFFVAK